MDINSRIGNHTENMTRSEALVAKHLEDMQILHPKFDYENSDYCHCAKSRVEATMEFDGFLRLVHIDCGKILIDGGYEGELYMAPIKVRVEHAVTPEGDHYLYMSEPSDTGLEQDCGA